MEEITESEKRDSKFLKVRVGSSLFTFICSTSHDHHMENTQQIFVNDQ